MDVYLKNKLEEIIIGWHLHKLIHEQEILEMDLLLLGSNENRTLSFLQKQEQNGWSVCKVALQIHFQVKFMCNYLPAKKMLQVEHINDEWMMDSCACSYPKLHDLLHINVLQTFL